MGPLIGFSDNADMYGWINVLRRLEGSVYTFTMNDGSAIEGVLVGVTNGGTVSVERIDDGHLTNLPIGNIMTMEYA